MILVVVVRVTGQDLCCCSTWLIWQSLWSSQMWLNQYHLTYRYSIQSSVQLPQSWGAIINFIASSINSLFCDVFDRKYIACVMPYRLLSESLFFLSFFHFTLQLNGDFLALYANKIIDLIGILSHDKMVTVFFFSC